MRGVRAKPLREAVYSEGASAQDRQWASTYEEKFAACQAIGDCAVRMRKPGDWYVAHNVEVKNGGMLESRYGNGRNPILAIEDHWRQLTNLAPGEYLVCGTMREDRTAVKWNGFMWEPVVEEVRR